MLTGYIGISAEKVLFVLLTLSDAAPTAMHATVTSITLVGWLSALSLVAHARAPTSPTDPDYIGAVPYGLCLLALPGVLAGSALGPAVHRRVGARGVLSAFAASLVYETLRDARALWVVRWGDAC